MLEKFVPIRVRSTLFLLFCLALALYLITQAGNMFQP